MPVPTNPAQATPDRSTPDRSTPDQTTRTTLPQSVADDTERVLAATRWRSNAELVVDCVRLGYLTKDGRTLDPTYGRGRWWTLWRPSELIHHDLRADGVSFCDLPYDDEAFAHVAYDPPYVAPGGRATSTLPEFYDRYGLVESPRTPAALQELINAGLVECVRVLARRGTLLVKCQDYVWGGKLFLGTHLTLTHALATGLECIDRLEMVTSPRPQPGGRPQRHARRNLSTLFVFTRRR